MAISKKMLAFVAVLAVLAVVTIAASMGGGNTNTTNNNDNNANSNNNGNNVNSSNTNARDQIANISYSGSGDKISEKFDLQAGVTIFQHDALRQLELRSDAVV